MRLPCNKTDLQGGKYRQLVLSALQPRLSAKTEAVEEPPVEKRLYFPEQDEPGEDNEPHPPAIDRIGQSIRVRQGAEQPFEQMEKRQENEQRSEGGRDHAQCMDGQAQKQPSQPVLARLHIVSLPSFSFRAIRRSPFQIVETGDVPEVQSGKIAFRWLLERRQLAGMVHHRAIESVADRTAIAEMPV